MTIFKMHDVKNEDIIDICYSISKKFILPKFKNLKESDLKRKNNNDLVTSVDIKVEKALQNNLKKIIPTSLFVGEELFENNNNILENYYKNNYCWTVDPIDGTTNFSKGKDKFAVMIALSFREKILQSWIYKPLTEEMFYAFNGGGAYLNDDQLHSNYQTNLKEARGSISTKYWNENYSNVMKKIFYNFASVHSYGCIGYEYIDIALGNREFAILSKLSPWDHIPGILIVREAGSYDTYFEDAKYNLQLQKRNLIVASNNDLMSKILNLIKENKNDY